MYLSRVSGINVIDLLTIILILNVILSTVGIALLVPNLGLFISLIGAFCSTALALGFPPLIELLVHWNKEHGGPGPWLWFKNIFILILACVGFFTGTYQSLTNIIKVYGEE